MRRNTPDLLANLRERWLGAPFLPALALLGALRRPWQQRTAFQHLFFILVPATAIMATFAAARGAYVRHYFVLTPFLLIWGANGLVEVARWTNRNVSVITHRSRGWGPGALVSGFIVIVMLSYASKDTRNLFTFREGSVETHGAKGCRDLDPTATVRAGSGHGCPRHRGVSRGCRLCALPILRCWRGDPVYRKAKSRLCGLSPGIRSTEILHGLVAVRDTRCPGTACLCNAGKRSEWNFGFSMESTDHVSSPEMQTSEVCILQHVNRPRDLGLVTYLIR